MHCFIILSGLLLSMGLYGQSFSELSKRAFEEYQNGQFAASADSYRQAFDLSEGRTSDYYNAACSYALSDQADKALFYLFLAAEKGWRNIDHLKTDKDLLSLHDKEEWAEVLNQVQANKEAYEKDFDKELQQKLEHIYIRDQTLRQLLNEAENKFGRGSAEMNYYWSLIQKEDSICESLILEVLDDRGWPGKSLVGGKANLAVWLVYQHAPLEIQEQYLPLLKESVAKGESQGSHLAMSEDRILMRKGQAQKYGSQITMDPDTGENTLYELQDPSKVNEYRASVGLGPLQEYAKRFGIEWQPPE